MKGSTKTQNAKALSYPTVLILAIISALALLTLPACSAHSYSDSMECSRLLTKLEKELSVPNGEFVEYSTSEISFFFPDSELYDDFCIVYSADSVDIVELGAMHASSEANAARLLEDAKNYIRELQEQKKAFIESYSPAELEKLNCAEARRYGNYVIFTIAEQSEKSKIFENAELLLKE